MFCGVLKRELQDYRQREQTFESTIEAIKDHVATIEFTPSGEILDANRLFQQATGYRLEQLKGQHHRMLCNQTYANSSEYRSFWQSLTTGESHRGVLERRDSSGAPIWLEATYFTVRDNGGRVSRIIKMASDVTEETKHMHDQQAILQALDRSQAMITFTPDGTIITANDNFLNAIGYQLDQIRGKHHRIFCFDDFYSENPDFWSELSKGKFRSGLYKRRNARGGTIWLEASYNPIFDANGKVIKVIKFASDVSKRVEANIAINEAPIGLGLFARDQRGEAAQHFHETLPWHFHIKVMHRLAVEYDDRAKPGPIGPGPSIKPLTLVEIAANQMTSILFAIRRKKQFPSACRQGAIGRSAQMGEGGRLDDPVRDYIAIAIMDDEHAVGMCKLVEALGGYDEPSSGENDLDGFFGCANGLLCAMRLLCARRGRGPPREQQNVQQ
ncbi:MAG: PAS domain S-box protein [Halothiobacillus sp.]|nr:PAS domain S-box protein [Halothiobacillus sp.]